MPLAVREEDIPTTGKTFLVFYSNIDDSGVMWCPDCQDVEEFVQKTFDESSELGLIVYVGAKPEWKSSDNKYRKSHNIQSIPTIVRINEGKEEARLVESEILQPGKLQLLIRE